MNQPVDWDAAARRAGALAPAGPPVDRPGLHALVGSLRQAAADAPAYVADVTGLHDAAAVAADLPALVVDRPRWARAASEAFAAMTGDSLPAPRTPGAARFAGEQLGAVLALLASRVLGQFDPYTAAEPGRGRLLLVAPNVLATQRKLDADPSDFHLWVALHEQTHAVQFAAAPWLAEHLAQTLREVMRASEQAETGAGSIVSRIREIASEDQDGPRQVPALLDAMLPEEQRAAVGHTIAAMSLLEGHADVVMDEVGPTAVPTVRHIRAAFERRRDSRTLTSIVMRRLLGMDAKLLQYRQGAAFVRGVREVVGHAGLNAAWTGPDHLPSPQEILDPALWVARVHG